MATPKVFLTRRWPAAVERHLAARFDLTRNEPDTPLDNQALAAALRSFDALCPTVTDRLTAELLEAGSGNVKIIANYGVGVSHIDLAACERLGIVVTNTPEVLTESTADIAITLMLMTARRAGEGERRVRAHAWQGWGPTWLLGTELTGKTLGLIGFGRIGRATARKAHHGFGMRVVYHARHPASPQEAVPTGASRCESPEELLGRADFVSLHCPGGPATRHLIDARRLAQMKPSAFLINTARGEVVDEAALAAALGNRVIAGAGLDVYEHEPLLSEALLTLENVVLLPHLGSATQETRSAMGMRVADNLERFFSGLEPGDRVA